MELCSNRGRLSGAHVTVGRAILATRGTMDQSHHRRSKSARPSRLANDNTVTRPCQKFGNFVTVPQHTDHFSITLVPYGPLIPMMTLLLTAPWMVAFSERSPLIVASSGNLTVNVVNQSRLTNFVSCSTTRS